MASCAAAVVLGTVAAWMYPVSPRSRRSSHAPAPADRTIWAGGVERLARLPFRPDAAIAATDLAPVLEVVAAHIMA